jgi:hypothetical protein
MADYTQSKSTILSHQALTHPDMLEGTPVSVAGALSALVTVRVANVETTANATGVGVYIQGSHDASGDDAWFLLAKFVGSTTAAESEALTATEPAAETVMAVASTTNLVVGDLIYIQDTGTVANSEWHRIVQVTTNTSIEIDYGLANEKDSSDVIYTEADEFVYQIDCSGLSRVNVLVVHEAATGSNIHVLAEITVATDLE